MRYIEKQAEPPKKAPKEPKQEPRVLAGSKNYDYNNLSSAKKIPTKGGYR